MKAAGVKMETQPVSSPSPVSTPVSKQEPQAAAATLTSPPVQPAPAETPITKTVPQPTETKTATKKPSNGHTKLTGLAAMKEALAEKTREESNAVIPITQGALHVYWEEFIERFRQANKMTVVSNLQLASLEMLGQEEIGLKSRNLVQHRFMEEEKLEISEFFKQKFNNPAIVLTLILDESLQENTDIGPQPLSSREQFAKMVEKYPLVKELKDRLLMELDF